MAETRRVVLDYAPRRLLVPYHERAQRWAIIVAHRRFGKTVGCINDAIRRAILLDRPAGRYAYVAPFLAQGKEIAWEYLKRYSEPIRADKNEGELWVELLNGARLRVHGADNPDRLRGAYLDGVILDEYADMRPSVWGDVIRPMLADRRGWATFIGTPKGHNEFYELWQRAQSDDRWFHLMLRASTTGVLPAEELESARADMTPEQYDQEFECSFEAAIQGAYFGQEMAEAERQGRVTAVSYEPHLPVHTAWDLGKGMNMAVWLWQLDGSKIRVLEQIDGSHDAGIPSLVKELNKRPYKWGDDWVPHDAKAREIGNEKTRVETLIGLQRKPRVVPDHRVEDGINAARLTIPRCWFDREGCKDGLEALRQYRAEFDEKMKTFRDTPLHNWASHPADAFRYMAMAWREITGQPAKPDPVREMLKPKSFDQVMKEFEMERDDA